jgi:eukaryotic-like serine/threonine-protein kinase
MRIEDERRSSMAALVPEGPAEREVSLMSQDSGPCLSEEEVLAFSEGGLMPSEIESVHAHLDGCPTCLELVNAAVHHGDHPRAAPGDRIWMATFGAGQTIAARYEIERFVGRGGMGEVYLAFDRVLRERVALKTLLSTISDNPHAIHRLLSEARLARRVSHPNVCRVHDVGVHEEPGRVDDRLHFLTMEYIEGKRLAQLLRPEPMAIAMVLDVSRQILAGLGAAHAAGVLHRDLKSDNIMVSGQGAELRIAIMDFGLSQALGDEGSGRLGRERVGSVSYMAPEQILGHELSPATDLFAFGVVLYEMLCAVLPFASDCGMEQTALRRLSQRAAPPSQLRPEVGSGLDRLVLRCLMDKPEDRWASAEQTLAALEEAVVTGRPSAIYPKLRSCAIRTEEEGAVADAPLARGCSKA